MKKYKSLVVLFLFFLIGGGICQGQTKMEELELIGKVKEVVIRPEGGTSERRYFFSPEGKLVKSIFSGNDFYMESFFDAKERFIRFTSGKTENITIFNDSSRTFENFQNGTLESFGDLDSNGNIILTYQDSPRKKINGKEYDSKNNILAWIIFYANGEVRNRSVFEYDANDRRIVSYSDILEGKKIDSPSKRYYKYNIHGFLEKIFRIDEKSQLFQIEFEYKDFEVDNQGNWIRRTGGLTFSREITEKREIFYY